MNRGVCAVSPSTLRRSANGDAHYTLGDCRLRPDGVQEFVFGQHPVWMPHEIVQQVKGFRRQREDFRAAPQAGVIMDPGKAVKDPLRGGGHDGSPRAPALRTTGQHMTGLYTMCMTPLQTLHSI